MVKTCVSSGANFLGALKVQEQLGPDAVVVTVLPDDNKKYLSTDLQRQEPPRHDFLAPQVRLVDFDTLKRECSTYSDSCLERAIAL